jgi:hypothetical protein
MRRLAVLIALVVVSGCGLEPGAGSSPGDLEVIVPPELGLPPDLLVSCPNGPAFPVSALETVVPVSHGDELFEAMAPFLESEEGRYWPQEGWQLLHRNETEAIVAHSGPDGVSFMLLSATNSRWEWAGAQGEGPCPLQYQTPEGLNAVDWRVDPSIGAPGAEDETVAVLLMERECVGGQEIGDRLRGPQIVMTDTHVRIAFAASRPPGDAFDCQGNPETPYLVELPEPIGDRVLVEGLSIGQDLEDHLG